ncbi:MAG: hypothetical protein J7L96_09965, partial [Bacteroidales bacterium]|nr:hypothetical protein [Bacteroidales bacterium]
LLLQFDLIGLERDFVLSLRGKVGNILSIPKNHIQIFASHTHSGPETIKLNACGEFNPEYLNWFEGKVLSGLQDMAMEDGAFEDCHLIYSQGKQSIGVNRRNRSLKTDSDSIWMLGFQRPDRSYKAIMLNMAMHPVCLRGKGISADYPGQVSGLLESKIDGNPLVLFSLGPAGDIDPPGVGVSNEQMEEWSNEIADGYYGLLSSGTLPIRQEIKIESKILQMPEIRLGVEDVDLFADAQLVNEEALHEFGPNYLKAVESWRQSRRDALKVEQAKTSELEISLLTIGDIKIAFVNAELFSSLTI